MMRIILLSACAFACASALGTQAEAQEEMPAQCGAASGDLAGGPPHAQSRRGLRPLSATETLAAANRAARQGPADTNFIQARQVYTYVPGAIYELYANPAFISTILLQPGETLNDVAAGDTSRWMVQETSAEGDIDGRTVVLVKPQSTGLRTNIVLVTDRRTYTIEAIAQSGSTYSAQVAWCYPESADAPASASVAALNFAYRIRTTRGSRPSWLPVRAFDDGRRTWIELPAGAASTDMPPVFVITGEGAELANYRVQGQRYIIDRLFDVAELRLGTHAPIVVRIEREGLDRRAPQRRIGHP